MKRASLSGAVALAGALAIGGLAAPVAAARGDLLKIVSPAQLERFDCFPVEILLDVDREKLRERTTRGTFLLGLNRQSLVDQLEPTGTGFRVLVSPENGLRVGPSLPVHGKRGLSRRSAGVNSLLAITEGPDGRLELDRRRFVVRLDDDQPPASVAGPDQIAFVGEAVRLDGTASSDPTCTPALHYDWSLVETPEGSAAELSGADTAAPTFEPDVPGTYDAELVVSNGALESEADTVSIAVDVIDALALGPLQSPVLDVLDTTLQPVAYNGTQDVAAFDIVVVDGDAHSPAELSASAR